MHCPVMLRAQFSLMPGDTGRIMNFRALAQSHWRLSSYTMLFEHCTRLPSHSACHKLTKWLRPGLHRIEGAIEFKDPLGLGPVSAQQTCFSAAEDHNVQHWLKGAVTSPASVKTERVLARLYTKLAAATYATPCRSWGYNLTMLSCLCTAGRLHRQVTVPHLGHTVSQLLVVHGYALGLVQGHESPLQEKLQGMRWHEKCISDCKWAC
eukprot:1162049-Pelagomonas_calceolata.AAC.8